MEDYLTRPVLHLNEPLASLLKAILMPAVTIMREVAPSASTEYRRLCRLQRVSVSAASLQSIEQIIRSEIADGDEEFSRAMSDAANRGSFRGLYRRTEQNELGDALQAPSNARITREEILESLAEDPDPAAFGRGRAVVTAASRIWRFLRRLASPRYHNAFRVLDLYGSTREHPIDVFAASSLDFDWSLTPRRKSTTIAEQTRLMHLIAIVTNGRVLPFVGYDPRRDVETGGEAFSDVKDAVLDARHLGIKLYPPMGFAPSANATISGHRDCEWPENDAQYGAKLDEHLNVLYGWAAAHNIPILAHTNQTMGITRACQEYGGHEDWEAVLAHHPSLSVCAGHFGGLENERTTISNRMRGFVDSIRNYPDRSFFADLAFLPELFDESTSVGAEFGRLLEQQVGTVTVADHVLFGTDWFMISQDKSEKTYVASAAAYLKAIGGEHLVDTVIRRNPTRFLGLASYLQRQSTSSGLNDLEEFAPHWAKKITADQI